ncbi:MAG: hypothetical protein OIN86_11250 [Candidatus Methanoperedens sp.]|nr:hypothetical protein [Candidatus Methanoperedens sp.]CAG1009750.1 Soluble epoxide hydrolase [Methanosarcinales archaeon]
MNKINTVVLDRNIKINNLNIYYQEAGQGEPILLLHGWPTSSFVWRKVIKPLAEAGHVIAPDCHHYLQEEKPDDVNRNKLEFLRNT